MSRNRPTPLLTYFLSGLCVLITAAYLTSGDSPGTFWYRLGHFGLVPADQIWDGKYYALFTAFFIHGNIIHIAFDLSWLLKIGAILEGTLNPLTYILFIVAAAGLGSGAELAFSGQTGIGASGVVYAMFGLMWAGRGRFPTWRAVATRENLNLFIIWGLFCVFTTWTHIMAIANAAHGAGFVFGLSIGYLFFAPRRRPIWAVPLAGVVLLTILSLTWVPWFWQWNFWKGSQAFARGHYRDAVSWYRRSLNPDGDAVSSWHNIAVSWHNIAVQAQESGDIQAFAQAEAQEAAAEKQEKAAEQAAPRPADANSSDESSPTASEPSGGETTHNTPSAKTGNAAGDKPGTTKSTQ